jgi:cysteine synthase A
MIYNNISELVGKTPIVKLNRLVSKDMADVYVKLESFNPGGSVKDRIALQMFEGLEKDGLLKEGDTIVESTSGNTGIGLAMIAAAKGYQSVFVMPESMSIERRKLLKMYGAQLVLTEASKGMKGANAKAEELANTKGYVMLRQFENPNNPLAHVLNTGVEIASLFESLDAFVSGVGTGGTITGTSQVLKAEFEDIEIVAVEPKDSNVLSNGAPGPHKIQGIGAGFIPDVLNTDVIDSIEQIENNEAIEMMRRLAKEEGILTGISSGAAVEAALRVAKRLGTGKKLLVILPDTGERYLSTEAFE